MIDFGLAVVMEPRVMIEECCGTTSYMAPEVFNCETSGARYDRCCDLFALGVTLYELTEKCFPFGKEPEYLSLQDEFRQPELIDEATGQEIDHLFALISGLLDWSPQNRLGSGNGGIKALRADPYWGLNADWEAADAGKMRSQFVEYVAKRNAGSPMKSRFGNVRPSYRGTRQRTSDRGTRTSDRGTRTSDRGTRISDRGARGVHASQSVKALFESFAASRKLQSAETQMASWNERDVEWHVEGWEFVSSQALHSEYVEMHAASV